MRKTGADGSVRHGRGRSLRHRCTTRGRDKGSSGRQGHMMNAHVRIVQLIALSLTLPLVGRIFDLRYFRAYMLGEEPIHRVAVLRWDR